MEAASHMIYDTIVFYDGDYDKPTETNNTAEDPDKDDRDCEYLCDRLRLLFQEYGALKMMRYDNGHLFKMRQFRELLAEFGINRYQQKHRIGELVIERAHGTLALGHALAGTVHV